MKRDNLSGIYGKSCNPSYHLDDEGQVKVRMGLKSVRNENKVNIQYDRA